jgi:hypothetical protein
LGLGCNALESPPQKTTGSQTPSSLDGSLRDPPCHKLLISAQAGGAKRVGGYEESRVMSASASLKPQKVGKAELKANITDLKAELKAEKIELKADFAHVKTELEASIADIKAELKTDIIETKAELITNITTLGTKLKADVNEIRTEIKIDADNLKIKTMTNIDEVMADLKTNITHLKTELKAEIAETRADILSSKVYLLKVIILATAVNATVVLGGLFGLIKFLGH